LADKILRKVRTKKSISKNTIKRRINEAGIFGYVAASKPYVNEKQRKNRLEWALEHQNWTIEQWSNVLFSDESPFVLRWKGKQMV
jgi:hypothetical protein